MRFYPFLAELMGYVNRVCGLPGGVNVPQGVQLMMICYLQMPDTGEIAARLGLSKTAVSARISRGRRLLRDIVEREGFSLDR